MIHERHLELALEIRNGPQALDDNGAALFARKVGQQLVGVHDRDVRNVRRDAADKLSALLRREHGAFFTVIHHADDQPVKAARRTGDDVEMTVCDRVEAAGVNCCSHGASRRLSSAEDRHRSLAVTVIPVTRKTRNVVRKGLLKGSFTDYYTTVRQNVNF